MDSRLKQRLIGAFVIVLLAVIFVPYLVQEPAEPTNPVANTAIPPTPESLPAGQSDLTISLPESTQPPESTASIEQPAAIENTELSLQPPITEVDIRATLPSQEVPEQATEELAEAPPEPPVESTRPAEIAQPATPPPTSTESSNPSSAPQAVAESPAPAQRPETPAQPRTPSLPQVNLVGRANTANERASTTSSPPPRTEQTPARRAPSQPSQPASAPRSQVAKAAPAQGVNLPKVELIGRSMSSASSAPSRTASRPQTVSAATQTPRAAGGRWAVQVGSFSLQQNANNMRNRLRSRNFSSSVETVQISGQTMYRVRVGPYRSRNESEQALTRLRQAGISSGQVISLNN